jgi:hypothetical protein
MGRKLTSHRRLGITSGETAQGVNHWLYRPTEGDVLVRLVFILSAGCLS